MQVLDGSLGQSTYHTYQLSEFKALQRGFDIGVGANRFTLGGFSLDIPSPDGAVSGKVNFGELNPWPVTLLSPGIMGPYAWAPGMECYHGVLSFDHPITGMIEMNGKLLDFTGGRGYIEKDWGKSFPSAWVWFQSNHFDRPEVCITASTAVIPWMGRAFRGLIVGLWLDGKLYRFATYTGARTTQLQITDERVDWTIVGRDLQLAVSAERRSGGLLHGPTALDMGKRIVETMQATVDVRLSIHNGQVLFSGRGRSAGLEVHGDLERLLAFER